MTRGEERWSSLKLQFLPGKQEALLYHAGFSLSANKWYRLSFFARSVVQSKIEFAPLMATAPWETLGASACFSIDTAFKSFSYVFKPLKSFKDARVNFKSNATFWIDNVKLYELGPEAKTSTSLQLVYNPTEKPKQIPLSWNLIDLDGKPIANQL